MTNSLKFYAESTDKVYRTREKEGLMSTTLFILLIVFQVKHMLADNYPFQTSYMAFGKGKGGLDWLMPLVAHVSVHGAFTFVIVYAYTSSLMTTLKLTAFDVAVHFIMDRVKASPNMLGKIKMTEGLYWTALGFDQMIHHITGIIIIYMLTK